MFLLLPLLPCLLGTLHAIQFQWPSVGQFTTPNIAAVMRSQKKVLQDKVDHMSADVNGLKKSVDILKTETESNKHAVDDIRKLKTEGTGLVFDHLAKLKAEMADHKKDVMENQKKLHSEMKKAAHLEKDLMDVKNEITTVNEDIANIKTIVTSLQNDVAEMKTQIHVVTKLKQEMAAVKANVTELTKNVTSVMEDVNVLSTQNKPLVSVCPAPPQVHNAHVANTRAKYVHYKCKSSSVLCGTARVECVTGGLWEDPQFSCEQSQWDNVGGPANVPVPRCFKTGIINITGRPSKNTSFEVALGRENGDLVFYHHIRIQHFLGHRQNCFNTFMGGKWEHQMSNNDFFPWLKEVQFQYRLEVTPSSFEVTVDGQHMISFPNRYPSFVFTNLQVRPDAIVDNIVFTKN